MTRGSLQNVSEKASKPGSLIHRHIQYESFVKTIAADLHCTKLRSATHICNLGHLNLKYKLVKSFFLLPFSEISSKISSLSLASEQCFSGSLHSSCLPALQRVSPECLKQGPARKACSPVHLSDNS